MPIHAIRPNCRQEGDKLHADTVLMLELHFWSVGLSPRKLQDDSDTVNDINECRTKKERKDDKFPVESLQWLSGEKFCGRACFLSGISRVSLGLYSFGHFLFTDYLQHLAQTRDGTDGGRR